MPIGLPTVLATEILRRSIKTSLSIPLYTEKQSGPGAILGRAFFWCLKVERTFLGI